MFLVTPSPFASPFAQAPIVAKQPVVQQPPELTLPRFLNYLADLGGCAHYRILWAEQVMNSMGMCVSHSNTGVVGVPQWYQNAKVVQIQRQASDEHLEFVHFLKEAQKQNGFRMIYNIDDVPFREHIPDYNRFKFAFDSDKTRQNIINIMNMCDEVIVTCDYMRNLFTEITGKKEITVIPNFPPHFWMGHQFNRSERYAAYDKHKRKPRILYPGSGAHFDVDNNANGKDDFEDLIKFIIDTRVQYQWVFLGAAPPALIPYVQSGEIELHPWSPLLLFPRVVTKLDPTVIIAPLQNNSFNKAKSDIKFVEASMLGIPSLLQNIETYSTAPAELKFDNVDDFKNKLEQLIKNKQRYYKLTDELRKYGETRFLELPQNIGCFYEAYMYPYGSPERNHLKRFNPSV
jgi:glycosyltransferase involved in cell wall biosynthesis